MSGRNAETPRKRVNRQRSRVGRVLELLRQLYPDARCSLTHQTPFELLVATILSAQCTDARVNQVTPHLFARFPNATTLAEASLSDVEALIHSTGFFRAKARNLIAVSQRLARDYDGAVPADMDVLTSLPGVGRKTANVVLGNAFGIESGVVVDTHVKRLSYRLGWTDSHDPLVIEKDLMARIPRSDWIDLSHRLILHGRAVCKSQRPRCESCSLSALCPRRGVNGEQGSG